MSQQGTARSYVEAPTRTVAASGALFAYRELGPQTGIPLLLLTHLGANLDGLAQDHRVIAVDYRGVGDSTGRARDSIEEMADVAVALIQVLGHDRVDMVGLSMGGMVAQAVAARAPRLIDRLILARARPCRDHRRHDHHGAPRRPHLQRSEDAVLHAHCQREARRPRVPRATEGNVRPGATSPSPGDVSGAARRGAPLGPAGACRTVVGHRPGVHRPRRQRPDGAARQRHRAGPTPPRRATVTVYPDSGHGVVFQYRREFLDAARDFLYL